MYEVTRWGGVGGLFCVFLHLGHPSASKTFPLGHVPQKVSMKYGILCISHIYLDNNFPL